MILSSFIWIGKHTATSNWVFPGCVAIWSYEMLLYNNLAKHVFA